MDERDEATSGSLVLSLPLAFAAAAEDEGRRPSEVAVGLIGEYVRKAQSEHDDRVRAQVLLSLSDPGPGIDPETVMKEARQRLMDRLKG